MGGLTNTELLDFTGGINTIKAPHLIDPKESVLLVNVDLTRGALQSVPRLNRISGLNGPFFTEFMGRVFSYARWRSEAVLDNKLYWADGATYGKIMPDGTELTLGLPTPATPATLTKINTGDGPHKGDFKYTYTFYSTDTGVESAPASLPLYLAVNGDDIDVTDLEALPADANRYRIYRIGGYLPTFQMVAEIQDDHYTDKLDDTEIDGRLLHTMRCGQPPSGINFFTELSGRLYGAKGSRLFFSALGNGDAWYVSDFYILQGNITAVAKAQAGLLIFGMDFTYLLQGNAPQNFRLKVLSDVLGCISAKSIAFVRGQAVWLGRTGIYTSDGYNITNLTADKIEKMAGIDAVSSTTLNDVYYVSFRPSLYPTKTLHPSKSLFPAKVEGAADLSKGVITLDFKRGNGYSFKLLDFKDLASVGVVRGKVHATVVTKGLNYMPCILPLECDEVLECSPFSLNIMDVLTTQGYAELRYKSAQLTNGSIATLKEYDKVRVNFIGTFNFKVIFVNGEVIVDEKIYASEYSTEILGIPNSNNKSEGIQFEITGVGKIRGIQYSYKMRELP